MKDKAFWFGAFEYRDELGGVLVGTRNPNPSGGGGRISTAFAQEPLTDPIGTLRGDWKISNHDSLSLHYGIERLSSTGGASFLSGQPIGSASSGKTRAITSRLFKPPGRACISPTLLNRASYSFNNFINNTDPIGAAPELDFPSIADGSSYRVPQQTRQKRSQWDDSIDWVRGKHNLSFGGRISAHRRRLQSRRLPDRSHRVYPELR